MIINMSIHELRVTTGFLCALLTLGLLTQACASGSDDVEAVTATSSADSSTETDLYASLPSGSYQGEEFNILNNTSNFAYTSMDFEEQTGDVLDDAIYARTRAVEERLDVDILVSDQAWDANLSAIRAQIMSGDDVYDICFNEVKQLVLGFEPGMFVDVNTIDEINLDMPWWNRPAIDSINIGQTIYYLFGDLHLMLYECYSPIVYNRSLAAELGIEDLYDTVIAGDWTLDLMHECMTASTADLNGDTRVDAEDRFGISIHSHIIPSFFTAGDAFLVTMDGDNMPQYDGISDRFLSIYEKLSSGMLSDKSSVFSTSTSGSGSLGSSDESMYNIFLVGRAMFYVDPLGSIKRMRDADFEVGILPLPKFDESQEEYLSHLHGFASAMIIPSTNADLELTGTVLENLCAESYRTVKPVYFDKTLDFKYAKDERSTEMLDIIFENGNFDIGVTYGWGGLSDAIVSAVQAGNSNLMSAVASLESKFIDEMNEAIEAYK